jgi:MtN3 and saliva related transmembrane protein
VTVTVELTTALGILAGVLTTACWVPQVLRSARTRSTGDLSWPGLCALVTGVGLWVVYGMLLADPAIMAANGASLVAILALARLKWRFDRLPQ